MHLLTTWSAENTKNLCTTENLCNLSIKIIFLIKKITERKLLFSGSTIPLKGYMPIAARHQNNSSLSLNLSQRVLVMGGGVH